MIGPVIDEVDGLARILNSVETLVKTILSLDPKVILIRLYNVLVGRRVISQFWLRRGGNTKLALLLTGVSLLIIWLERKSKND